MYARVLLWEMNAFLLNVCPLNVALALSLSPPLNIMDEVSTPAILRNYTNITPQRQRQFPDTADDRAMQEQEGYNYYPYPPQVDRRACSSHNPRK